MGIEQTPDAVNNGAGMEPAGPRSFIAEATRSLLVDRAQAPDIIEALDADLRQHHGALPRATPTKVDFEVAKGKRQAVLGSLAQVGLWDMLERATPLVESRDSLVVASLPGPEFEFVQRDDPDALQNVIFHSTSGSSRTFVLSNTGWLVCATERVQSRAENPDDENHQLWVVHKELHEEYGRALEAEHHTALPELRRSLRLVDQASAITTGQLLVARAVSYSRLRAAYPTGPELTRSALQAANQLSWMIGTKFNLAFKYLNKVNWLGKFSAFEAGAQGAAYELFTGTPDLFNAGAAIQWRIGTLRKGPVPHHKRGYCPIDVPDDETPLPQTPQIIEDFIGAVEDRYELAIPRDKNGALPGSTAYVALGTLLAAETMYDAWPAAMQRNSRGEGEP